MTSRRVNPSTMVRRLVSLLDSEIRSPLHVDDGQSMEFHAGYLKGLRVARQTISKG
ncbi:hypothetical protein ACFQ1S_04315 [Kibdelosporangium lantanae]|uniref:Uncharacterized protein n=1 Tax=Kibdelosporangium lantanae TaxID=1497396 RepID=A0ABW3M2M5_9PSEU